MTYLNKVKFDLQNQNTFTIDGRTKSVGQFKLFDWKTINREKRNWSVAWTWTSTFQENYVDLAVWPWQYEVRQWRTFAPYFSWNPQEIEITLANFQLEAWLIKRFWYFSSSIVAPYTADLDWFFVESNWDDNKIYLKIYNFWNLTIQKDITSLIHDWSKFSVAQFEFLWLWWAWLKYSMIDSQWMTKKETYSYVWQDNKTFTRYPSQPVRYEIRSTTWTWFLRCTCSQITSQWWTLELWENLAIDRWTNASTKTWNSVVNTFYPVISLRLNPSNRHNAIILKEINFLNFNSSNILLRLFLNPTITWIDPVSWVAPTWSSIQYDISRNADANTITWWTILYNDYIGTLSRKSDITWLLLQLSQSITATDEIVLWVCQLSAAPFSVIWWFSILEI